jgi:hypothetical protein
MPPPSSGSIRGDNVSHTHIKLHHGLSHIDYTSHNPKRMFDISSKIELRNAQSSEKFNHESISKLHGTVVLLVTT